MNRVIDLHHHLIYGVDDGAQSQEEMQQMLLKASAEGVTDIVCTPHATPGYEPFRANEYAKRLDEARRFIKEQGIDLCVHPGSEIFYTDSSARLVREGQIPTLAGSKAVLVEFAPDVSYEQLSEAAIDFGVAGYSVVFAHVERYGVLRNVKRVRSLRKELGVHMQVNANTVISKKGFLTDRWLRRMFREGLIDCVATDAHNLTTRPCKMRQCYELLEAQYGTQFAAELCGGFQRRLLEI